MEKREVRMTSVRGIHHITVCPGPAQEDLDFFTGVLGQRLVKQTVLMDGRFPIYHFYYGNADADIGSIATSFPYARRAGRAGAGQVSAIGYSVPRGAMSFWRQRFDCCGIEHGGVEERFGARYIRARHPAGLLIDMVEEHGDPRRGWTTRHVSADVAARGFFGAVLSVSDVLGLEQFLVDALGFEKVGVDGPYHRFQTTRGTTGRVIDLHHDPRRVPGTWGFGAGTAHHIAFNLETDEALLAQKALYEELGFTDASEVKDRFYFHSMYVRAPGGILVECTSNVPGGLYQDEAPEELGTKLHLPPWFEEKRAEILSMLDPIRVPDENRPAPGSVTAPPPAAEKPGAPIPLSRRAAEFVDPRNH